MPLKISDSDSPWAECDEEGGDVDGGSGILTGTDLGECVMVLDDADASDEAEERGISFSNTFLDFSRCFGFVAKFAVALAWRNRSAYDTVGPERAPEFVVHEDLDMASLTSLVHLLQHR